MHECLTDFGICLIIDKPNWGCSNITECEAGNNEEKDVGAFGGNWSLSTTAVQLSEALIQGPQAILS